jgi:hypothetical protein
MRFGKDDAEAVQGRSVTARCALNGPMTGDQIKRLTNDANDDMPLVVAGVGLTIKTNVAVIVTLRSSIEILEKRLQGRVKSKTAF